MQDNSNQQYPTNPMDSQRELGLDMGFEGDAEVG
jgi:hypothetical protein